MTPPILKTPGEGRTIAVVGDVYRFLAVGRDTGGAYAQWEALVPPGGGPPPHTHSREQECFYILEGEITFRIGERTIVAGPGTFAGVAPGTAHAFKNESDRPARMILTIAPAGLEEMFFAIGTPLDDGATTAPPPSPDDIVKLKTLAPQFGIELLPPAGH
ncbi:MAG: cupin domain-containing protein [Pirellulales bacterium]